MPHQKTPSYPFKGKTDERTDVSAELMNSWSIFFSSTYRYSLFLQHSVSFHIIPFFSLPKFFHPQSVCLYWLFYFVRFTFPLFAQIPPPLFFQPSAGWQKAWQPNIKKTHSCVFSSIPRGLSDFKSKLARVSVDDCRSCASVCLWVYPVICSVDVSCADWQSGAQTALKRKPYSFLPVSALSFHDFHSFISHLFPLPPSLSLRTFLLPDILSSWGVFVLNLPLGFHRCYFSGFDSLTVKYVWTAVNVSSCILTFFLFLCVFSSECARVCAPVRVYASVVPPLILSSRGCKQISANQRVPHQSAVTHI